MTSSELPVTREELEAILRRTIVSCFRNPAPRKLIQDVVEGAMVKFLMPLLWWVVGFYVSLTLLKKVNEWLGWGEWPWWATLFFFLALVPAALYFQVRHSAKARTEEEKWDERIETWMSDSHHMKCQNCGFKGDHVQDFMSTGMPDEECCPKCGSGKYYVFRSSEDE